MGDSLDEMITTFQKEDAAPEEDFASLLEGSFKKAFARLAPGDRVQGRIVSLGDSSLLVDVGQRCEAFIERGEFSPEELAALSIGDLIEAFVVRTSAQGARLSRAMSARNLDLEALAEAAASGVPVDGRVSGHNKGGFEVALPGEAKGFVPFSQIEFGAKQEPDAYVGQTFRFRVMEVRGRDVILSRAALQREEMEASRARLLATLQVGDTLQAPVVKIEAFGVFVDIGGGVNALVPMSEISWTRADEAKAGMVVGQVLTVKILRIEQKDGRPRISASVKAAGDDPWVDAGNELMVGRTVKGRVTRLMPFGAFVEVLPGIEGLIHVSEMTGKKRVNNPAEVVRPGEEVTVSVTAFDPVTRRVGLSLKALEATDDEVDAGTRARYMSPDVAPAAGGAFAAAFARARERAEEKSKRRK